MCLAIDKKVRNNHHKENGYCVGYKVLKIDNTSPYQHQLYRVGWEMATLGEENSLREVNYGLHLFLNKKDAIMEIEDWFQKGNFKIVKVYYLPKDVIAYGTFNVSGDTTTNVVVKKLLVKSLEDVR